MKIHFKRFDLKKKMGLIIVVIICYIKKIIKDAQIF